MPSQRSTNSKPTPKKTRAREVSVPSVPMPTRGPGESLTPEQRLGLQDAFIAAYADKGTIRAACLAVGINRSTFYDWQEKDQTFHLRAEQALAAYRESLRDEIHRRGKEGWDEEVYQEGQYAGTVHKYSDSLLMFHSKMHMPEYRDKSQVDLNTTVTHQGDSISEIVHLLSPDQRAQLKAWILAGKERQE